MRRTWQYAAMTKDEGNAADDRFSATAKEEKIGKKTI